MFELKKWEPFKELSTIQREMDELFKRTFGSLSTGIFGGRDFIKGAFWSPQIDRFMKDGNFVIHADLPGVDPKNIEISVTGNTLLLRGERKTDVEDKKGGYYFHETSCGTFERTLTLPDGCDVNKAHATYKDGVLELSMPVKAEALPKKIKVELDELKEGKKAA